MFFSIQNLRASVATELPAPWDFKPESPPPYGGSKADLIAWASNFATKHAFISGFEGTTSSVRVTNTDNPPFKLHAIIADYDAKMPDGVVEFVKTQPAGEFMPNYLVETASGNYRLVWVLERPVMLVSAKQTKELLKAIARHMKLAKWLPGLDTEAFGSPDRYFELGKAWHAIEPQAKLPASSLELWLIKASFDLKFDDKQLEYKIPIEDIAKEVESRFPGRWKGHFDIGARGRRFWDATADNETAAVVREDGMLAFTGDRPFVSWKEIFGAAFVSSYESSYIAGVVDDSAYDGRSFWLKEGNQWNEWSKEDFSQELRVRGYEGRKKQGSAASELDTIENTIKKTRRVHRALPFLFMPKGVITFRGQKYLNISKVKPIEPTPPLTDGPMPFSKGREHFTLIYKLLKTMFVDESSDESTSDEQLTAFLAWLKYFYANARALTPKPGHTIVIAGPVGKGKTLLSKTVLGGLLGGECDASNHFVEGDKWTANLIDSPIARIDDSLAVTDTRGLLKFSNRLKRYTANSEMVYEEKFKQIGSVPWMGRTVVTCNLDSESLRILPDMDLSTRDKISLFKASDHKVDFPDWQKTGAAIAQELPAFARFLEDWTIPEEWIAEERRFGTKPYHHPELMDESKQAGLGTMIELLHSFLESYKAGHPKDEYWCGSATVLHSDLAVVNPEGARELRTQQVATLLGKMSKNGFNLHKFKDTKTKINMWKIGFDLNKQSDEVTK